MNFVDCVLTVWRALQIAVLMCYILSHVCSKIMNMNTCLGMQRLFAEGSGGQLGPYSMLNISGTYKGNDIGLTNSSTNYGNFSLNGLELMTFLNAVFLCYLFRRVCLVHSAILYQGRLIKMGMG